MGPLLKGFIRFLAKIIGCSTQIDTDRSMLEDPGSRRFRKPPEPIRKQSAPHVAAHDGSCEVEQLTELETT